MAGTRDTYQMEKRYFHKNRHLVWIQLNVSIVRNEAREPLYFISQIQDITQRKNAEMEIAHINTMLKARTEKLEVLNKELEGFSYSVSHDLRAPLRSIAGYAQILEEDYSQKLDDEGNQTLQTIIKNAEKMGQLIDDLLEFSRLGRKGIEKRQVDINKLIEGILQELKAQEQERIINVKIHPLEEVAVDSQMIKQVWVNLIANALKYTRNTEVAEIEIGSNVATQEICFYIRDNGVGFNMDYKDKLFKVFQRLHSAEEFEGTGVGLALVKRIIDRHGGKIWAEAKENEGATFYFTIPK
jgi:light-regulated signal transduction histidine kinase (bacteriophytochrome)